MTKPERQRCAFCVYLPADCTNKDYVIRKLLDDDPETTIMIEHHVVADLTEDQVQRLAATTPESLDALRNGPSAVDVPGVWPGGIMETIWRKIKAWWPEYWVENLEKISQKE